MVSAALLDTLSDIGAIGGILAIVGVGLLILLVAAQARELRSMREWIEGEPERQQETTQKVIAEVQRRIAAARERRQAAKGAGAPPSIAPPAPRAPAPGTLGDTPEARALAAAKGEGETATAAAGGSGADAPTTAGPRFAPLAPAGQATAEPGDSGGDGAGNDEDAVADDIAAVPDETTADDEVPAVVAEFGQETVAADALPDQEEEELAVPPFASRSASREADTQYSNTPFDFEEEPASRTSKILVGGGLLALLVGIVLLGSQLFSGGEAPPANDDPGTEQTAGGGDGGAADTPAEPERVDPATINVQVLNGTQITGLAQRVTDRVKSRGYGTGQPETASEGTIATESTVAYREGHRQAAEQIAEELGLSRSAVRALTAETSAAVGETFEVVVTAGRDLDTSNPAGTTG